MRHLLRQLEESASATMVVAVPPWARSTLDGIEEIADLETDPDYAGPLQAVANAYRDGKLHVHVDDADLIWRGLVDLANSEDGQAEEKRRTDPEGAALARKAQASLSGLADKVFKMSKRRSART